MAHHKIPLRRKSGRSSTGASQNLGVTINISVMAEASEFKFGIEVGFA